MIFFSNVLKLIIVRIIIRQLSVLKCSGIGNESEILKQVMKKLMLNALIFFIEKLLSGAILYDV